MGTRADFYIGEGKEAEWLGSVAWDGYEWEHAGNPLKDAKTPEEFKAAVENISKAREDYRDASRGWPWPWDDSRTTDYAYCYTPKEVKIFVFGRPYIPGEDEEAEGYVEPSKAEFPNMKDVANVTDGGFIVISAR